MLISFASFTFFSISNWITEFQWNGQSGKRNSRTCFNKYSLSLSLQEIKSILKCFSENLPMTVTREPEHSHVDLKGSDVSNMLQKHWGSTRTVRIYREPSTSLGISIVGGKVSVCVSFYFFLIILKTKPGKVNTFAARVGISGSCLLCWYMKLIKAFRCYFYHDRSNLGRSVYVRIALGNCFGHFREECRTGQSCRQDGPAQGEFRFELSPCRTLIYTGVNFRREIGYWKWAVFRCGMPVMKRPSRQLGTLRIRLRFWCSP